MREKQVNAGWSDGLHRLTRQTREDLPIVPGRRIRMKNPDHRYGSFNPLDRVVDNDILHLADADAGADTGATIRYVDVDAVINAGWAVD